MDRAARGDHAGAPAREGATRIAHTGRLRRGAARGALMSVDELVESLLYEGYALYPYTPGATKNATPTPFGIVYPPAYARSLDTTHDHLELRCVVEGGGEVRAEVRFLVPSGERHRAEPQRVEGSGEFGCGGLTVRTRLAIEPLDDRRRLVSYRVENLTEADADLD